MAEFNADDYEITVSEDGIIESRTLPGHEPEDMVMIPFVVTGYTVGVLVNEGDKAFVIDFNNRDGTIVRWAITPELLQSLISGLTHSLEREWT